MKSPTNNSSQFEDIIFDIGYKKNIVTQEEKRTP